MICIFFIGVVGLLSCFVHTILHYAFLNQYNKAFYCLRKDMCKLFCAGICGYFNMNNKTN